MSSNADAIREVFADWAEGRFSAGAELLDDDVVFIVHPSLPEVGNARGPEGVRDYMRDFLRQWENYRLSLRSIEEIGSSVVVNILQRGRGRTSGIDGEVDSYMVFTFAGERVTRIESMLEREEALVVAGGGRED